MRTDFQTGRGGALVVPFDWACANDFFSFKDPLLPNCESLTNIVPSSDTR